MVLFLYTLFIILDDVNVTVDKYFEVEPQDDAFGTVYSSILLSHEFFSPEYVLSDQERTIWSSIDKCRFDNFSEEVKEQELFKFLDNLLSNVSSRYKRDYIKKMFKRYVRRVESFMIL